MSFARAYKLRAQVRDSPATLRIRIRITARECSYWFINGISVNA